MVAFSFMYSFFHVTRCGKKKMFADWARMIQWLVLPNHWYISKFADKCDRIWRRNLLFKFKCIAFVANRCAMHIKREWQLAEDGLVFEHYV